MSSETIPEWAREEANSCLPGNAWNPLTVERISNALLAAEQRGRKAGLEEAASAVEKAEQALKDWLHIYAPDLCAPDEVRAARARVDEHGTIAYIADALAAIRSLGEQT